MNFEFLKGLTGLGYVYENCSNAEKLAVNMPVQSVFTSRKSAELLAKFIYLAAHNQEVEMLTFADKGTVSLPMCQYCICPSLL